MRSLCGVPGGSHTARAEGISQAWPAAATWIAPLEA
jgi:hypothetical protein